MYANQLLDAYKTSKNYIQDKQIAHDLGVGPSRISEFRSGKRQMSDTQAIFLAENANIDIHEALIYLAADKAKDHKAQQAWQDITAKLSRQGFRGLVLGLTGFLALVPTIPQYALCTLC
ncbi:DUF3693 domain-containing protein [Photobacterium sp. DA100]|uniref:DUF3693 domain-containing protein n=1 Tax=Photobacterium sp. DA100 TaxID=3027472 RepID=UPI0024796EFF|nr:DUF3693 domain-containing protein [Photobacterium sp. DA100]WEM43907.1 DUF3693 domain-containing protein [Photobacterium sp. DA100]